MTAVFRLEVRFHVVPMGAEFGDAVEDVLIALEELDDVVQADATASEAEGWVDVEILIGAPGGESYPVLIDRAFSALRTGVHAAGIGTPDWPDHGDLIAQWKIAGLRSGELVDA